METYTDCELLLTKNVRNERYDRIKDQCLVDLLFGHLMLDVVG